MIYPNKHIKFEESILYKMLFILEQRTNGVVNISELYKKLKRKFNNIDEFIYAVDVLYVLEMIEIDFDTETLEYVK